jgi:hypothetical protein
MRAHIARNKSHAHHEQLQFTAIERKIRFCTPACLIAKWSDALPQTRHDGVKCHVYLCVYCIPLSQFH